MMLTTLPPHLLPRALAVFSAALTDRYTQRVFRRIAVPGRWRRAESNHAALHHLSALRLARQFGMSRRPGRPQCGYSWDGRALRTGTEAYVLLHEVAHFQLAPPARRRRIDFGLGPGPETGDRAGAERERIADMRTREREEAMASLLGILWEIELGQPGLASFLDQNWLEGAGAARHFSEILAALRVGGFVTSAGRPTRRRSRAPD
ncbi:MAG TPA: hypothetical protein VLV50_04730 [Stellaceae bacterium]|nr:hypothetical protein [Stellaceae bacterium]